MRAITVRHTQHGAVLFVALVFLLLLTLLGLTAAGTSVLQERMTGGMRNTQLALMGAESALRGGELEVWTVPERSVLSGGGAALPPCTSASPQPCAYQRVNGVADARVATFRNAKTWLDEAGDGGKQYAPKLSGLGGNAATAALAKQPRYLVEDLGLASAASSFKGRMAGSLQQELGGPSGGPPPMHLFRITARSHGGSDATLRVVESVFGSSFSNYQFNPDAALLPPAP